MHLFNVLLFVLHFVVDQLVVFFQYFFCCISKNQVGDNYMFLLWKECCLVVMRIAKPFVRNIFFCTSIFESVTIFEKVNFNIICHFKFSWQLQKWKKNEEDEQKKTKLNSKNVLGKINNFNSLSDFNYKNRSNAVLIESVCHQLLMRVVFEFMRGSYQWNTIQC